MDCPPGPADIYALAHSFVRIVLGEDPYKAQGVTSHIQLVMMEGFIGSMPDYMAEEAKRLRPGFFKEHTYDLKPLSKNEQCRYIEPLAARPPLDVSLQ
jgi:hypothetical protein